MELVLDVVLGMEVARFFLAIRRFSLALDIFTAPGVTFGERIVFLLSYWEATEALPFFSSSRIALALGRAPDTVTAPEAMDSLFWPPWVARCFSVGIFKI